MDNDIKQWFKSETQNTLNFFREHLQDQVKILH